MANRSKRLPKDQSEGLSTEGHIFIQLQQGYDIETIFYLMSRRKENLSSIVDNKQRRELSGKYGVNFPEYDEVFSHRLKSQIIHCKHRYMKDNDDMSLLDSLKEDNGSAKSIKDIVSVEIPRFKVGISALDRLLGTEDDEGLPEGSCLVFGAKQGVGKTRLTVDIASYVGRPDCVTDKNGNKGVLYIQNEEKLEIFRTRAAKNWTDKHVINLSNSDNLIQHVAMIDKYRPRLVIVDSLHDTKQAHSRAGVAHMLCTYKSLAQSLGCSFWMISHLTTDGKLKGGSYTGHKVDFVLMAEREEGLSKGQFCVHLSKNRYGEVGDRLVFEHTKDGINFVRVLDSMEDQN